MGFSQVSPGYIPMMQEIIKTSGIRGLYRGWAPTILRDCPFSALYWLSYEQWKPVYAAQFPGHDLLNNFISGSSAGLVAAFITHPFDVLKTQQQLIPTATASTTNNNNNSGTVSSLSKNTRLINPVTLSSLYREEGISGWYRGLGLRLITVIPACGIMIAVYEGVKTL
jgi:solute carrier family 25 protein 39/40